MHFRLSLICLITLAHLISACEGGETIAGQRLSPIEYAEAINPNKEPIEDMAGEMLAGEMLAGEMLAGEMLAGEMLAGEMLAGEMLAGDVIMPCGLQAETAIQAFTEGPLPTLASSCAVSGCHNATSFRQFKLSFGATENFTPEQIEEALDVVEPFITLGDGVGSPLSGRMIDGHSDLDFTSESPKYLEMVEWIDQLVSCDEY